MKNSKIQSIKAQEILDSRGNPTIKVNLITNQGIFQASVPSGASKGKYEAVELRDGGKRYLGKGVKKAIENIEKIIAPKIIGKDPRDQKKIDNLMINLDGTKNKSRLGANAILAVSIAVCRAGAKAKKIPLYKHIKEISNFKFPIFNLPVPCFNIINGGMHAGSKLDFQEFMIVPQEKSFSENLRTSVKIYQNLKQNLKKDFGPQSINLGDEGGFAPPFKIAEQALDYILNSTQNNVNVKIILDVAASQFYEKQTKNYKMNICVFTKKGLIRYYLNLVKKYPIIGLEDPFSEDDWQAWKMLKNQKLKIMIIADDLTATNKKRIKEAKEKEACNSLILKPNQIGTVTEAIEAGKLAKSFDWKIIVSHRSGETSDSFIADLAVGIGADFIKAGAPARGERLVKYNRLLEIEKEVK